MRDSPTMCQNERNTLRFIRQLSDGATSIRAVAKALKRTTRHVYRLLNRCERFGNAGLIHRLREKPSNNFPYFAASEDAPSAFRSLRLYLERYGIMRSLYCDRASVFGAPDRVTVFSDAMGKLGVEMIYAGSPQAKGRVERVNRTHQDRLVKALREEGICDAEVANRYLLGTCTDKHNAPFAHPAGLADIHPPLDGLDPDNILCEEIERHVYPDMSFRLDGLFYITVGPSYCWQVALPQCLRPLRIDGVTLTTPGFYANTYDISIEF